MLVMIFRTTRVGKKKMNDSKYASLHYIAPETIINVNNYKNYITAPITFAMPMILPENLKSLFPRLNNFFVRINMTLLYHKLLEVNNI